MSAIAHWIEQHGINTVVIGLVRLHLEKILPPRSLWVPFELGRPLGAPADSALQRRVLLRALQMVESATAGQIDNFDDEDSRAIDHPDWQAPMPGEQMSIHSEIGKLARAQSQFTNTTGRTVVGVAGVPVEQCAKIIDYVIQNQKAAKSPREEISDVLMLRLAIDDIKAFYTEAALYSFAKHSATEHSALHQIPHGPSSRQIGDWFWLATYAGTQLRQLREKLIQSDDVKLDGLTRRLVVPHRWRLSP